MHATAMMDGSIVECKDIALNPSEASGLRCRIMPSNMDVSAHYDPERQAVTCTAPKVTDPSMHPHTGCMPRFVNRHA